MTVNRLLFLLTLTAVLTVGCGATGYSASRAEQPPAACTDTPSLEQTIERLTACLPPNAPLEAIERTLRGWDRIGPDWGGVREVNMASGGGQEIIIRYYPERLALQTPPARFAVLQRDSGKWRVLFDESMTIEDNEQWHSEVIDVADATGDGYDDVLLKLSFASRHYGYHYGVLLTAHPNKNDAEPHIAFARTAETPDGDVSYEFKAIDTGQHAIQTVERFDYYHAVTRTYSFDGASFAQIDASVYPQDAADIPPQFRLGYDSEHEWHVYRCDQQRSVGGASARICGMKTDGSRQQVIVDDLVSPVLVSPDGQWLVFAAPTEDFGRHDCQASLWKMSLTGTPRPLVIPEDMRVCSVHSLEWQRDGDEVWVGFRNWDGSVPSNEIEAMPSYQVNFENGILERIE